MELKYVFYIGAGPEKVWHALISPQNTKQIYYGSVIESTFEIGSVFKYVGPGRDGAATVHVYGEVLAFEENRTFTHTCKIGAAYGEERDLFQSRVSYQLEPAGANTKLTVIHDQWLDGDPAFENTANGWWLVLSSLKTLVETGKSLDLTSGVHD